MIFLVWTVNCWMLWPWISFKIRTFEIPISFEIPFQVPNFILIFLLHIYNSYLERQRCCVRYVHKMGERGTLVLMAGTMRKLLAPMHTRAVLWLVVGFYYCPMTDLQDTKVGAETKHVKSLWLKRVWGKLTENATILS